MKLRLAILLAAFSGFVFLAGAASPGLGILPAPAKCNPGSGTFALTKETKILWRDAAAKEAAGILRAGLKDRTGLELAADKFKQPTGNSIDLELVPGKALEAYSLSVSPTGIAVRASAAAGLFYGVQSLLQIVAAHPAAPGNALNLPAANIEDAPRFEWRGLMLDESRHFFGKQTVQELLDVMASLKLNRFHWHLTDEPGWRIEIKKYPKLTRVGGIGNWSDRNAGVQFYTQADIRDLVEYARKRHILVVPEIDMPGHATAACRAYPAHSGGGEGFTFNPGKEETYQFLEQVLREVAALFPGPYVHLGGDEVHFGNQSWNTDPDIVRFTWEHGLRDPTELEHYFMRRMAGVLQRLGKTTMGWDEIAAAGIAPGDSAVMWWRHDKPQVLSQLLEANYRVVLCPRLPCYFDFVQDNSHRHGRQAGGRLNSLAATYQFPEPVTDGLIPAGKEVNVLGLQACVWTERMASRERLAFMIYPRLAALAEAAWTPAPVKDLQSFTNRVPAFLRELDRRKIPYFNPFAPASTPEVPGPTKKAGGTANG